MKPGIHGIELPGNLVKPDIRQHLTHETGIQRAGAPVPPGADAPDGPSAMWNLGKPSFDRALG